MVLLIAIVGILLAVAAIAYAWGAWKLAQYGFRISTGTGLAVLLIPPYTLVFGMKLQESGKELPLAASFFGIIASAILIGMFSGPLGMVVSGRMDEVIAAEKKAEMEALAAEKKADQENPPEVKPVEAPKKVEPAPTPTTPTTTGTPAVVDPTKTVVDPAKPVDPAKAAEPAKVDPIKAAPAKTEAPKADAKPVEKKADAPK